MRLMFQFPLVASLDWYSQNHRSLFPNLASPTIGSFPPWRTLSHVEPPFTRARRVLTRSSAKSAGSPIGAVCFNQPRQHTTYPSSHCIFHCHDFACYVSQFLVCICCNLHCLLITMPHCISPEPSPRARHSKHTSKARRLLSGKGVAREDSDDELGMEDYGWEWLYDKVSTAKNWQIVGARHGQNFTCHFGDCVLLKADSAHEAWVGLVCGFQEDHNGEKLANFMWFSSDKEIRNKQKKRTDALSVSLSRALRTTTGD